MNAPSSKSVVARLKLLDPTADQPASETSTIIPVLSTLAGTRIGLLDNSKTNVAALLGRLGETLVREHGVAELVARTKLIYSRIAPDALLDELAGRCDAVITAIGD